MFLTDVDPDGPATGTGAGDISIATTGDEGAPAWAGGKCAGSGVGCCRSCELIDLNSPRQSRSRQCLLWRLYGIV